MKKHLSGAVLLLACGLAILPANGQDLTIDIGTVSCPPGAYASSGDFRQPRAMELSAKIYIDPSNDSTTSVARSCAERAKQELGTYGSPSNIQLVKETFQRYLEVCTRKQGPQIRTVKSVIVADGRCS